VDGLPFKTYSFKAEGSRRVAASAGRQLILRFLIVRGFLKPIKRQWIIEVTLEAITGLCNLPEDETT
jgi:hypothetical protein